MKKETQKKDTATAKDKNRRIRKEALREQLAAGGHLQHVVDIAKKLSDDGIDLDVVMVQRLRAAADIKLKLINKYLPDLKSVEISQEADDEGKPSAIRIEFVSSGKH